MSRVAPWTTYSHSYHEMYYRAASRGAYTVDLPSIAKARKLRGKLYNFKTSLREFLRKDFDKTATELLLLAEATTISHRGTTVILVYNGDRKGDHK